MTTESINKFKAGDKVQVKGIASPIMIVNWTTIAHLQAKKVTCIWFIEEKNQTAEFSEAILELVI